MPLYEYHCKKCDHNFDVQHSPGKNGWHKCPRCKGKAARIFSPPTLIFKGSGFHVTDYNSSGRRTSSSPKTKKTEDKPASPSSSAD